MTSWQADVFIFAIVVMEDAGSIVKIISHANNTPESDINRNKVGQIFRARFSGLFGDILHEQKTRSSVKRM